MRRGLAWLLTLPLAGAGVLVGHALAYRLTGTPLGDAHHYLDHAPHVALVLATLGIAGVAVRDAARRDSAWPYAVVGSVAFVAQEHLEVLLHSGEAPWLLTRPAFLVGLALQVPVALLCVALARRLLQAVTAPSSRQAPHLSLIPLVVATRGSVPLGRPRGTAFGRGPPTDL